MKSKLSAVRREIQRLETGTRRRYSPELRAKIASVVAELRREGWTWDSISEQLGTAVESLRQWHRQAQGHGSLVPVEVKRDAASARKAELTIVLPNGTRVEGLDVESAITVARALS